MNTFKIVFLALILIDWIFVAYMHGEDRPKYNILVKLTADFFTLALLALGGFFVFN